jgi:hypothetical protein
MGISSNAPGLKGCMLSRRQGAVLFELRRAMDLAELFLGEGDLEQARAVLAPVVESFHEHREGRDYRRAQGLLDQAKASIEMLAAA